MICLATGLPHPGDPCDRCVAFEKRLAIARADPAVVAARAADEAAWQAYNAGRGLPLEERYKLEKAWCAASDAEREAFTQAVRRAVEADIADALRRQHLTCASCGETIPDDAPRSVAEDDTVWCEGCYETSGPAEQEQRPRPSVPTAGTGRVAPPARADG